MQEREDHNSFVGVENGDALIPEVVLHQTGRTKHHLFHLVTYDLALVDQDVEVNQVERTFSAIISFLA